MSSTSDEPHNGHTFDSEWVFHRWIVHSRVDFEDPFGPDTNCEKITKIFEKDDAGTSENLFLIKLNEVFFPLLSRPKTKCMDHYTLSGPDSTRLILSYGE